MTGHHLTERVAALIAPLVPAQSSILIGLSGGVDSVVLLHLLHLLAPRYSWKLSALHVHHGISPKADAWADFCTGLCATAHISLHIERVDIAPLRAHGIEAAARKLRHAAFSGQACDFVALAHHADDQAETLLLQLLRGAGVKGVAAMPVVKRVATNAQGKLVLRDELLTANMAGVNNPGQAKSRRVDKRSASTNSGWHGGCAALIHPTFIHRTKLSWTHAPSPPAEEGLGKGYRPVLLRPLLHCSRREILGYAAANGLQWIEDESNTDDSYPRNFLRHRLLPLLEQKFPAYRDTLMRSALHFAEASELLDDLARLDSADSIHADTLAVAALHALSRPRAKNVLRYFLHNCGAPMPQAVQLDDMLRQLCDARQDAVIRVEYGGGYDTLPAKAVCGSNRRDTLSEPEGCAPPCQGDRWEVHRYQGRVYAFRILGEFDRNLVLPWRGEPQLDWPALNTRLRFNHTQGAGISLAKLQRAPVTLRLRRGGELLRPHPNAAMRTLKNLLQEHRVPSWHRDRLPLLYCGEELACVPGVAIAAEYQAAAEEPGIQLWAEQCAG